LQLPIFNEQFVIDRLIERFAPWITRGEKLEIQVLDDSTDETQQVASEIVARLCGSRTPHRVYSNRTNRYGFKAGALDAA